MKPLAIIPARAGSQRLPGKNLMKLGGEPLLRIAVDDAAGANIEHIVISTDIPMELIPMTRAPVMVLPRPAHLAGPDVPMMDAVRHVMSHHLVEAIDYDSVVLLQPTSPLRLSGDIMACIKLLETSDAAMTVKLVEAPELFTLGHAGRLRQMTIEEMADGRRIVVPNGAVFAARRDVIEAGDDWWTANVVTGLVMPPERSVDIDTIVDFEEAERLWTSMNGQTE